MKKIILIFILVTFFPSVMFPHSGNNRISAELNLVGAGLRYERMLSSNFSIGFNAYANLFLPLFLVNVGVTGNLRLYPGANNFFVGLGFGYNFTAVIGAGFSGFGLIPEVGGRFDIGQGRFFLESGVKLPFTFDRAAPFGVLPGIVPYLGLGFVF